MRLIKPVWVQHGGNHIYSIHCHPDGKRFSTCGQDEKVKVWQLKDIAEGDVNKEYQPLCTMTNHTGSVNCVRFSNDGRYLASGGDDKVVILYELRLGYATKTFGVKEINKENWVVVKVLKGHVADVVDMAWRPGKAHALATASLDNTIIIWNGDTFEREVLLQGHQNMVKGLCWDPIGKYLASQSDDQSVRVWRTRDWEVEKSITEPFDSTISSTFFLRLSWSPDGSFIVSAQAQNEEFPVAAVIGREDWKKNYDLVGHEKAVVVARWNSHMFGSLKTPITYCALGGQDNTLTIWRPDKNRAIVGCRDLFSDSIVDISWCVSGHSLLACSLDGTIAYLEFQNSEIGKTLKPEETASYLKNVYGNFNQAYLYIPETADQLGYMVQTPSSDKPTLHDVPTKIDINMPTAEEIFKKQKETKTKDGRRRIMPTNVLTPGALQSKPNGVARSTSTSSSNSNNNSKHNSKNSSKTSTSTSSPFKSAGITHKSTTTTTSSAPGETIITGGLKESKSHKSKVVESSVQVVSTKGGTKKKSLFSGADVVDFASPTKSYKRNDKDRENDALENTPTAKRKVARRFPITKTVALPNNLNKEIISKVEGFSSVLPEPSQELYTSCQILTNHLIENEEEQTVVVEVQNDVRLGSVKVAKLVANSEGRMLWESYLSDNADLIVASSIFVAIASRDQNVHVFSPKGRRMLPSIFVESPVSYIKAIEKYLLVVTVSARCFVWNIAKGVKVTTNLCVYPILSLKRKEDTSKDISLLRWGSVTESGAPCIILSNLDAYCFDINLECWLLIASESDLLAKSSDFYSHFNIVSEDETAYANVDSMARLIRRFAIGNDLARNHMLNLDGQNQMVVTRIHLEEQVARTWRIGFKKEIRDWTEKYVRFLTANCDVSRMRDMLNDISNMIESKGDQTMEWKDLIERLLPIIGTSKDLLMQRLVAEYRQSMQDNPDKEGQSSSWWK